MAKVVIHLVGSLREALGGPSLEVEMKPGIAFKEMIRLAAQQTGKDLWSFISDPETGEIHPSIMIFVDHENLRHLQGWDTPLAGGNEITILKADMAGG